MRTTLATLAIAAGVVAGLLAFDYLRPGGLVTNIPERRAADHGDAEALARRIAEARERSARVKGVYMTSAVANDRGLAATRLRNEILGLLEKTELSGIVIDVRETEGGLILTDELIGLIQGLRKKGIWTIARITVFKDSSQVRLHPEWYLRQKDGTLWRDNRGGPWLDPVARSVWDYTADAAKRAMEFGFDELQFDYIRFPSDGNLTAIVYPTYDGKRPKPDVLQEFFRYLSGELKRLRPDIILSADLFGYVALQAEDIGVGQRLADIGEHFDYVSLMVYPSHYYGGFEVPADPGRNLPALRYPYRSTNIAETAAAHPYEVVYRSLIIAGDILAGRVATATDQVDQSSRLKSELGEVGKAATSSVSPFSPISSASPARPLQRARLRPWLQDFDLAIDSRRKIHYDAAKVRAQIDAAEAARASGWLLWSPDNVYTKEALKPK